MNKTKVNFIWFSYKDDKDLLMQSMRSVVKLYEGRDDVEVLMTVVDDGLAPMVVNGDYTWIVDALGSYIPIRFKQSFYPRNGNLIGRENFSGQVKEMARAAEGAEILVKIDSDTLLLNDDWLMTFAEDKKALLAGSFKGLPNYPMGNCYAVRANTMEWLRHDVETYPAWINSFEDYEVGVRLHRCADGNMNYAHRYRSGVEDGFWLCSPRQVNSNVLSARVCSCGFDAASVPPDKKDDYKKLQLQVMQGVLTDMYGAEETASEEAEVCEAECVTDD